MIPFVGPSYTLANRKADVQRCINMTLRKVESGTGKPEIQFWLDSIPGLTLFSAMGAVIRGGIVAQGRCFVVAGPALYEVASDGTLTNRGVVSSSITRVDMAYGLNQVVIVDGSAGYVFNLSTNVTSQITSAAFYGADRVGYLDGYFIFNRPNTQQFYISAIDDATTLDALDFASAEGSPDRLVSLVVDHRELWLFGEQTTEIFVNTGAAAFPFERVNGAFIEIGCLAKHSAQKVDNSVMWLGTTKDGGIMVFRAVGYQPARVSDFAVEEALRGSTDIASATAYTYQQAGMTYYCLNAPGLETTLVYNVSSACWEDRAEINTGTLTPHRALVHVGAFNNNYVGDEDGNLYKLDPDAFTNAGDVLYRERTSPHFARPNLNRVTYGVFELDCNVGDSPQGVDAQVELNYSNDGGRTWQNWMSRSLGKVGEYKERVQFNKLGMARDRVWKVRCTDPVRFGIMQVDITALNHSQ